MCVSCSHTPAKPSDAGVGPGSGKQDAASSVSNASPGCPCTITSQTVATSPSNRTRTRIGVGEEVTLTVNPGPASWTVSGGNGTLSPSSGSNTSITYTAGDSAGTVTITAHGPNCTCTIVFTVVEPSNWTMKRKLNTNLFHRAGIPECGWKGEAYIHPNDVNFYRVEVREKDSKGVTTGSFHPFEGIYHGNYPPPDRVSPWFPLPTHTDTDGTKADLVDTIYSGYPGSASVGAVPPFHPGTLYFPMVWQWRVGTGATKSFPQVRQEHEISADGRCESRKGGHTEHTTYNDPASTY
jgi:type VI secretion system secreted protein VgrG